MASISDIHFGHRRNPTIDIIANLRAAFPDNEETAALDIIWIVGDVFDSLLNLPEDDVWEINFWIADFLRLCKKHNILARVLEGTPRHDWKQSQLFSKTNSIAGIGADIQYVSTLSIEYIERFGITVLYVPDEWNTSTEKTFSQVKELLRAKGLDKVDFALIHGQFEFQLPEHVKAPKHSSSDYLSIVREIIFVGHIHEFSLTYERIIAQGSFDRIAQGEEEPKGHVRAQIRADGTRAIQFVENKGAKIFLTVHCADMTVQGALDVIARKVADLPMGSYVRVMTNRGNPLLADMESVVRLYPLVTWSVETVKPKEEEREITLEDEDVFHPVTLTRENLSPLLIAKMAAAGIAADILTIAAELIEEAIRVSQ